MTQFHLRYHLQSNKNVLEAGEGVDTYSIWPHKANLGMKAKEIRQLPRNFQVLATNLNKSWNFFFTFHLLCVKPRKELRLSWWELCLGNSRHVKLSETVAGNAVNAIININVLLDVPAQVLWRIRLCHCWQLLSCRMRPDH